MGKNSLDGAQFFREAGLSKAACILDDQALRWGQAQTFALQERYDAVAACVDDVAAGDRALVHLLDDRAAQDSTS